MGDMTVGALGRPTGTLFQRNIWWSMLFTHLLVKHEDLRSTFPEDVDVVILPEDDPELAVHNMRLAQERTGRAPPVLVRMSVSAQSVVNVQPWRADAATHYALG